MTDTVRDILLAFVRVHVLHHAVSERVFGAGIAQELARHGYALSPGTLYPLLHRLEQDGLLVSEAEVVAGKVRHCCVATTPGPAGARCAAPEAGGTGRRSPPSARPTCRPTPPTTQTPSASLTPTARRLKSLGVPAARADLLRRAGRAPGLLPGGVRRPAAVARREGLRGSGGPVPVSAGAGQQPGGDGPGSAAGGAAGRPGGLVGVHPAFGPGAAGSSPTACRLAECRDRAWLHGLKVVAVAVVAQAVWGMARSLCPGPAAGHRGRRRGLRGAGCCPRPWGRWRSSGWAGSSGWRLLGPAAPVQPPAPQVPSRGRWRGGAAAVVLGALLGLPLRRPSAAASRWRCGIDASTGRARWSSAAAT